VLLSFRVVGARSYVMLMILIVNFIFSATGILIFGDNDPEHFGSLGLAMVSIWQVRSCEPAPPLFVDHRCVRGG
jgi:hypothetical protein